MKQFKSNKLSAVTRKLGVGKVRQILPSKMCLKSLYKKKELTLKDKAQNSHVKQRHYRKIQSDELRIKIDNKNIKFEFFKLKIL